MESRWGTMKNLSVILLVSLISVSIQWDAGYGDSLTSQGNISDGSHHMPIIEIDKKSGELHLKNIVSSRASDVLTTAQIAQIQKASNEKRKSINLNLINFRSGRSTSVNSDIEFNEPNNDTYYLIQFYNPWVTVDEDIKSQLRNTDISLLDYISKNAFYVKIPSNSRNIVKNLHKNKKIRLISPIPLEASINSQFLEKVQTNPDAEYNIVVHLFEAPSPGQLVTLKSLMQIYSISDTTHFTYGIATGGGVKGIQKLNFVKFVEEEVPAKLYNYEATSGVADDIVQFNGYTGSGVTVGVVDTGTCVIG